jgi:trehalose 6-phosphate phosphatase
VCVGVRSEETPRELEEAADLLVDGPLGVRTALEVLAGSS